MFSSYFKRIRAERLAFESMWADAIGFLGERLPEDVVTNPMVKRELQEEIFRYLNRSPPAADDNDGKRTFRKIEAHKIALMLIFQRTRERADYDRLVAAAFNPMPVSPVISDDMKGSALYEGIVRDSITSANQQAILIHGGEMRDQLRKLEAFIKD